MHLGTLNIAWRTVHLSTLKIAWRNLGRNKKRTALALVAIALGQFTLVFVNCMMAGMYADMLRTITGPLIGHVQIHHPEWREERATDLYIDGLTKVKREIEEVPGVEGVSPRIYSPVLTAFSKVAGQPMDADPGVIVGVDIELESKEDGLLASLGEGERPSGKQVAVGKILAARLGIKPGHTIALIGRDADEFPASGLYEVTALVRSTTDVVNRLGVVMSMDEAQAFVALPDQAHEIVVQGDDPKKAGDLARAISALPSLAGAKVLDWREAAPELVKMVDMKVWVDLIFVGILFVAAAAGIANTMMMSTFERTREFGMLLALGTRPGRIVKMIFVESVILGLVGVAIGSIVGTALVLITGHYGINYAALGGVESGEFAFRGLSFSYILYPEFELRQVLYGVCAVTVTAILAATWPAVIAARLEPAEAIRS